MRNRLLSSNGRPGEALRSCQDAGAGGAGIADVWDSAKDPAIGVSSRPFSYWEWGFTAMAVNRAISSHAAGWGCPDSAWRCQCQIFAPGRAVSSERCPVADGTGNCCWCSYSSRQYRPSPDDQSPQVSPYWPRTRNLMLPGPSKTTVPNIVRYSGAFGLRVML